MKKRNVLIAGAVGIVLLSGTVGVGAFSETNNAITVKKAEEKALSEVEGKIESVELKNDDGQLKYEVEVQDQDGNDDIDEDIDAKSGEVIKVDRDDNADDNSKSNVTPVAITNSDGSKTEKLTNDEAIAIATEETPGKVVEIDYDDDGKFEIEIHTDTHKVEYEIDAITGKILEKDIEKFDNDDRDDD